MRQATSTLVRDLQRAGCSGIPRTIWRALLWSGVRSVVMFRVADALHMHGHTRLAEVVASTNVILNGADIAVGAQIGPGLVVSHSVGVVIGRSVKIGANCTIAGGCVIGSRHLDDGADHPRLGSNVLVAAHAMILGAVTVGDDSTIAAAAVVLEDVASNHLAIGIPAHTVPQCPLPKSTSTDSGLNERDR